MSRVVRPTPRDTENTIAQRAIADFLLNYTWTTPGSSHADHHHRDDCAICTSDVPAISAALTQLRDTLADTGTDTDLGIRIDDAADLGQLPVGTAVYYKVVVAGMLRHQVAEKGINHIWIDPETELAATPLVPCMLVHLPGVK